MVDLTPIRQTLHERLVTGLLDALCNLLHRPVQRFDLPMIAIGCAVKHLRQTARIDSILECGCTLGAERPTINGTVGIAFDVKNLAIFDIDV